MAIVKDTNSLLSSNLAWIIVDDGSVDIRNKKCESFKQLKS